MVTGAFSEPFMRPRMARLSRESALSRVPCCPAPCAVPCDWPQAVVARVAVISRAAAASVEMRIIVVRAWEIAEGAADCSPAPVAEHPEESRKDSRRVARGSNTGQGDKGA